MSNVLERFRKLSEMAFYENAENIRTEMRALLMNQKNVPKKDRAVYSYPLMLMLHQMNDKLAEANRIFPCSPKLIPKRIEKFQEALDMLDPIYQRFQATIKDLWAITLQRKEGENGYADRIRLENRIETISKMLIAEENLLKGCIRKSKQQIK